MADDADTARVNAVFEAVDAPCALISAGGAIEKANAALGALVGLTPQTLVGRRFDAILARAGAGDGPVPPGAGRDLEAQLTVAGGRVLSARVRNLGAGVIVIEPLSGDSRQHGREREARLNLAIEAAALGAWEYDFDRSEGYSSGPCNTVFGLGPEPVALDPAVWRARMHPEDAERVYSAFMSLQYGGSFDETFRVRDEAGEWIWHHSFGERLPTLPGERAPRAAGFGRDVTERMRLQEALAQRDALVEEAIDAARVSPWTTDYRAGMVHISGAFARQLGYGTGEVALDFETWRARIHPEDLSHMYAAIESLKIGDPVETSYRIRCADGDYRWFLLQGRVNTQDSEGRPVRAAGFVSDVTEARALQAELAATRAMIERASSAPSLGFWEIDFASGRNSLTGGLARTLYGVEHHTTGWEEWFANIHPDDRAAATERASRVMAGQLDNTEAAYRYWSSALGEWRLIRVTGQIVERGPDGQPARLAGVSMDITEKEALREQLERREAQLREAVDAGSNGVWEMVLGEPHVRVIGRMAHLLGLPEGEERAASGPWISRLHREDRPAFMAAYERMVSGEALTIDVTYRLHTAQGDWVWINVTGKVTNPDAPVHERRAAGILRDITERETLRAELAERERNLADAVEAGLIGVWLVDHETGRQFSRGQVLRWMGRGLDETEITTDDWKTVIHPDDLDMAREALSLLNAGEPTPKLEYRLKAPEGWRWARVYGRPVAWSPEGVATRSAGVIIDIANERRYADALREESARLDTIYRQTPAMMHSIDMNGVIVQVSDHWLKHMGYERDEVIGRRSADFLTEESRRHAVEDVLPAFWRDGVCADVHHQMVRKDGGVIDVLLSARLERDAAGEPLRSHAILVDVTDKRAAERALQSHAAELERANRELDRFAVVASHDLQEPLRKISAFASLVRRRYADQIDPEGARSLAYLVDAAERMRRLIEDLLDYARTASCEMARERVDLFKLTGEVLEALDLPIAECAADVRLGDLPVVEGDPALIGLLMQNLLSNALKYRKGERPRIEITAERDGACWRMTVADDGIGLDEAFAEKIFAPFQRLHGREAYEGTGIGLAICQQVTERHGGEIWVESAPGEGARFCFTLPALTEAGRAAA